MIDQQRALSVKLGQTRETWMIVGDGGRFIYCINEKERISDFLLQIRKRIFGQFFRLIIDH